MKHLQSLFKVTKFIETVENYSLIDEKNSSSRNLKTYVETDQEFYEDEKFWQKVFTISEPYCMSKVNLYNFVVSDWVARIPGLYWTDSSKKIRQHTNADIALKSQNWVEFYPPGKSKKVMGGVGTILLPPTEDGKRLMSVSAGCNASAGIPVLFSPEVIDHFKIKPGYVVSIVNAKWQPMDTKWSTNFSNTKDLPKGYLVIDQINKIRVTKGDYPVIYHPFSLMEYEHQDTQLYDFVYLTVDSKVDDVDRKVERFFHEYAQKDGRNGEYLLNPNIVRPIFESRYLCPADLRHPSEKAKLNLLYERIRKSHFNGRGIEELVIKLPQFYQSATSIRTLAKNAGFNISLLVDDSAVSMSAQLINSCIEKGLIENLIDRMNYDYPQIFN